MGVEICRISAGFTPSRLLIRGFFRKNGINRDDFLPERYRSFNACFCRKIRPELRPIDPDPDRLIAPCDGLLSVFRITDGTVLPVKQSRYRIDALVGDPTLAERYRDGYAFVFRLCVSHYHRYIYPADGLKSENRFLPGDCIPCARSLWNASRSLPKTAAPSAPSERIAWGS